jgi:cob(I)alamin adenosyltransferase
MAVRSVGYHLRTLIWQFIKGSWHYGELDGLKMLAPYVEVRQKGEGFVGIVDDKLPREVHRKAALDALEAVKGEITGGKWDISSSMRSSSPASSLLTGPDLVCSST